MSLKKITLLILITLFICSISLFYINNNLYSEEQSLQEKIKQLQRELQEEQKGEKEKSSNKKREDSNIIIALIESMIGMENIMEEEIKTIPEAKKINDQIEEADKKRSINKDKIKELQKEILELTRKMYRLQLEQIEILGSKSKNEEYKKLYEKFKEYSKDYRIELSSGKKGGFLIKEKSPKRRSKRSK